MPREVTNAAFPEYKGGVANIQTVPDGRETIDLLDGGVDTSKHPERIAPGKSPDAIDVRLTGQGLSSESGAILLDAATGQPVMGIVEFQRKSGGQAILAIIKTGTLILWNGNTRVLVPGSFSGSTTIRPYTVAMKDRLLIANGIARIQSHDGLASTPIADLSDEAPRARYIIPVGSRLVAAYIKPDTGDIDPYRIQWSEDGDITGWTDPLFGAGLAILEPEGRHRVANFITGLSALETVSVIYRQSSIAVATRTGIGAAPFRFFTPVHGLGTESPSSIATVGARIGDLFLGHDLNVYLYNGQSPPEPVGDPIHRSIRDSIDNPFNAVGVYDHYRAKYWLGIPTSDDDGLIHEAWVLDVRELLLSRKIIWYRRTLPAGTRTIGVGFNIANTDPIVNTVLDIVNTVTCIVNFCGSVDVRRYTMFGGDDGGVRMLDFTTFIGGTWLSKAFGSTDFDTTIDRVYGRIEGRVAGQIKVGVSFDGGATVVAERTVNFGVGTSSFSTWHEVTGRAWQLKVTIVSGDLTSTDLEVIARARGRINSAA